MIIYQIIPRRWTEAVFRIYQDIHPIVNFTATQVDENSFVLSEWNYAQPIPTDDQITAALAVIDAKNSETPS